MENLRIMAESLSQKNEIITMLIDIGYKRDLFLSCDNDCLMGIHVYSSGKIQDVLDEDYNDKRHKEITIQQLRDLVVLKRNEQWDEYEKSVMESVSVFCDVLSLKIKSEFEKEVKMKEYLNPLKNGGYELSNDALCEGSIEVPEGAVALVLYSDDAGYWFDKENRFKGFGRVSHIGDFSDDDLCLGGDFSNYAKLHNIPVTWQRSETENTKQPTGIEATLAERQATYGCFEDVARTTEQIMKALGDHRVNGLHELPYPHRMALYMIASKMARIVNGDFNHRDSWHDIGGYAKLVEDLL